MRTICSYLGAAAALHLLMDVSLRLSIVRRFLLREVVAAFHRILCVGNLVTKIKHLREGQFLIGILNRLAWRLDRGDAVACVPGCNRPSSLKGYDGDARCRER